MPARIDTGMLTGGGFLGAGATGEIVRNAAMKCAEPAIQAKNLMDADILMGLLMPHFYVTVTGGIAIGGAILMILSYMRGSREKKKREERDKLN